MTPSARPWTIPLVLGAVTALPAAAEEPQAPALEVVARFPAAEEGVVAESRTSSGGEAVALFVRKSDCVELRISGRESIRYDGYVRQDPDFDAWNVVRPMGELDQHSAGEEAEQHVYLDWNSFVFDDGGAHAVWTIYDHGLWRVVADGRPGEPFDGLSDPLLGPGGHVAYAAGQEEGFAVCFDGRLGARHADVADLRFSQSGATLAYVAIGAGEAIGAGGAGEERVIVFGAEPGPAFDQIYRGTLRFAGDEAKVSYLAQRAGKDVAVIAGVESEPVDALANLFLFAASGKRCAYGFHSKDGWRVVLDGKPGPLYEVTGAWTFSPDGARFAYRARREGRSRVWLDGEEGPVFDDVGDVLTFSPDGKRVAYGAIQAGRWLAVVDGKAGTPCEEVAGIAFSADGKHVAHLEFEAGRFRLLVDGQAGEWVEGEPTTNPDFRPKSAEAALVVQGPAGKQLLLGKTLGPAWDWMTPPEFGADGVHCMVATGRGEDSFIVLDGEPWLAEGNFMTLPLFVRGGESLLTFIQREDGTHLVVDGMSVAIFDEIFVPDLHVDERGGVTVLARRGDELCRARWTP